MTTLVRFTAEAPGIAGLTRLVKPYGLGDEYYHTSIGTFQRGDVLEKRESVKGALPLVGCWVSYIGEMEDGPYIEYREVLFSKERVLYFDSLACDTKDVLEVFPG